MTDEIQEKIPFLPYDKPSATGADLPATPRLRRPNWLLRAILIFLSSNCLILNAVWWARYRAVV